MSKTQTIEYRLRHKPTNKFITVEESSNDGADFCYSIQHILSTDEDYDIWCADSAKHAEWVRHNDTPWYNATYDTPSNNFKAEDLEVVSVEIISEIKNSIVFANIPTKKEIYETKLTQDKGYKRILEEYEKECEQKNIDMSCDYQYSLYDLSKYNEIKKRL